MLSFALTTLLTLSSAVSQEWTGRYWFSTELLSGDCGSPCPAGFEEIYFDIADHGDILRAWIHPHQSMQLIYPCEHHEASLVCRAEFPMEAPGYSSVIDGTLTLQQGDGFITGTAVEKYTTTGQDETRTCTCTYAIEAYPEG